MSPEVRFIPREHEVDARPENFSYRIILWNLIKLYTFFKISHQGSQIKVCDVVITKSR